MANNVNTSKLKRMVKSKGFVTAGCAILAVVVLIVGYNIRIKSVTKPVLVPVANQKLTTRHKIAEEDLDFVEIPRGALGGEYYSSANDIVGKYVNVDTTVPTGSLFYKEAIVEATELPDEALLNVKEGETLYYLTVNMLTSYTNSILPNRYIDIYISTKENGKALVGKLIRNVKVLQVKTADGRNVFENSEESRTPYVIMFSLPESQHLLLRQITAINNYSIASENSGFSRIEIIPIPTTAYFKDGDEDVKPEIASEYLREMISALAEEVPDSTDDLDFLNPTTEDKKEQDEDKDKEKK